MGLRWRYVAQRIDGSGTPGPLLNTNLPLRDVSINKVLSGPDQLSGTIAPVFKDLVADDGLPLLEEWGTAIHAEADGVIQASCLYVHGEVRGQEWGLESSGHAGYPERMRYEGDVQFIGADPLTIVRHIWDHLQGWPGGNLGVILDRTTTTPVRVGTEPQGELPPKTIAASQIRARLQTNDPIFEDWTWVGASEEVGLYNDELLTEAHNSGLDLTFNAGYRDRAAEWLRVYIDTHGPRVEFETGDGEQVSFEAGPYKLNTWTTDNCGRKIDDLARDTPFEYRERHAWNADRTQVEHRIEFGYPRLGRRREDLRFVLGENIHTVPALTRGGDEFANDVLVLGTGDGRDQIMGTAKALDHRIRRTATIDAKDLDTKGEAEDRARRELAYRLNLLDLSEVRVINAPMTRLGSWEPGDEILIQADADYAHLHKWYRVTGLTITPEQPELIGMSLVATERVG